MNKGLSVDIKTLTRAKGSFFEIIRFLIVGSLATLTDLIISVILLYTTEFNENIITTLAFCIAFFVSYFGHKSFTFKRHGKILAFFALALSMLVLRNIIVTIFVHYIVGGIVAIVSAMLIVTAITYIISKFFVFKIKVSK